MIAVAMIAVTIVEGVNVVNDDYDSIYFAKSQESSIAGFTLEFIIGNSSESAFGHEQQASAH